MLAFIADYCLQVSTADERKTNEYTKVFHRLSYGLTVMFVIASKMS